MDTLVGPYVNSPILERSSYSNSSNSSIFMIQGAYWRQVNDFVAFDRLGLLVHFIGDIFRSRASVGNVVLDTKIGIGTTRVMTCS